MKTLPMTSNGWSRAMHSIVLLCTKWFQRNNCKGVMIALKSSSFKACTLAYPQEYASNSTPTLINQKRKWFYSPRPVMKVWFSPQQHHHSSWSNREDMRKEHIIEMPDIGSLSKCVQVPHKCVYNCIRWKRRSWPNQHAYSHCYCVEMCKH